jgi:hypothetical protein
MLLYSQAIRVKSKAIQTYLVIEKWSGGKINKYIISNLVRWLTNHGLYFTYNITNKYYIYIYI